MTKFHISICISITGLISCVGNESHNQKAGIAPLNYLLPSELTGGLPLDSLSGMESISEKEVRFLPLGRQAETIEQLIRKGKYRNMTHFMRCAVDCYLNRVGCSTLSEQARQMAEDFQTCNAPEPADPSLLQDDSRETTEDW
jgi:Arc/MetJ-type ribon-helix-helix transcriptional regulator